VHEITKFGATNFELTDTKDRAKARSIKPVSVNKEKKTGKKFNKKIIKKE